MSTHITEERHSLGVHTVAPPSSARARARARACACVSQQLAQRMNTHPRRYPSFKIGLPQLDQTSQAV